MRVALCAARVSSLALAVVGTSNETEFPSHRTKCGSEQRTFFWFVLMLVGGKQQRSQKQNAAETKLEEEILI
uniref:Putative secreted protein n=1 Tax=Anopheles darlingi TaxID=43151 RepID=A0A2M4DIX3_ANODA